jgi:hypothetical protein
VADDFAKEVRELYAQAEEADRDNLDEARLDLKFEGFEQWDERDRNARERAGLPVITVNVVQQYTGMVVGDWLQNETSIKVLPREDGDTNIAEVRSELIRSIELQSKAPRVYAACLGQMVACGISNFRVDVDFAYEDAFAQDIFIRDIPDPLAVRWDPLAFDPTGRDASYCFVGDKISVEEYRRRYPKAALPSMIQKECDWSDGKTVQLPEYWKITEKLRTFGMTTDGKTIDLTDVPQRKWPKLAIDIDTKQPIVREKAKCKYAVQVITNGMEQLTDPYELKLSRLPIIRVMGRETRVDGKRLRYGLVRALRDDQRMKNYLRSIRAELLMKAARVNFIAQAASVAGREADWDNTLVYNDGTQPPQEVTARNLAALVNEEQFFSQDMMDVTGIHEASRGMPSNETSGKAIIARQSEGDVATIIYHTNMVDAQQEAGEVINELIPSVYDTARTVRTVGADLGVKMVRINDPQATDSYGKEAHVDLTLGKYDVTISTGATMATRRQEAQTALSELFRAYPPAAQIMGDLFVKALDVPDADKMAERARRAMDPRILGDDANDGKDPEEIQNDKQKAEEASQKAQAMEQLQFQGAEAEMQLKVAQAQLAQANAMKAQAEAQKAMAEAQQAAQGGDDEAAERLSIEGYNAITNRLKVLSSQKDAPDALEQHLAPIIANAVGQALASHLGFAPVDLGLPSQPPTDPTQTDAIGEAA